MFSALGSRDHASALSAPPGPLGRGRVGLYLFLVVVCVAGLLVWSARDGTAGEDEAGERTGGRTSSHAPRFVLARIRKSEAVLLSGATGFLDIDVSLPEPGDGEGGYLRWDPQAPDPLLWVSSPPQSGIVFDDRRPEDRPGHHIVVDLRVPDPDTRVLTARVKYSVDSRAKAGDHILWLEVSAPLVRADGSRFQDMGVMRSHFQIDTHLGVKLVMLLVIGIVVFLFVVEWVRVDVVAILMMVLLPELGLLEAKDAFRGLSSNAVVAIIGVMIISFGLNRTGVVGRITHPLLQFVRTSTSRLIVMFSSTIAVISSVMQNTGAAVLFLPSIRLACREMGVPVSRVLMPIGMAAILGGTLTMVGTSPLILLNDLLPPGMPKFSLLELTPIGVALVVAGIGYLSIASRFTLGRQAAEEPIPAGVGDSGNCFSYYSEIGGPYEIYVPPTWLEDAGPRQIGMIRRERQVNIVAMADERGLVEVAPSPSMILSGGVSLLVFGPEDGIHGFVRDHALVLRSEPRVFRRSVQEPAIAGTVEIVVTPRSSLVGTTIREFGLRDTYRLSALALHQDGETFYRDMADRPIRPGDAILVHGVWEQLHTLQEERQDFIMISCREAEFQKPERALLALISFAVALTLMLVSSLYFHGRESNPLPLAICLMVGAVCMVLSRVMTITEAYRAVDWRTVFLLGGLIPLGMAVNQTGTAAWIAEGIVGLLGTHTPPVLLLLVLASLSCAFTLVVSNVGACALLVPLGISMARQTGIDPRVAAIVVGIGVSNAFILPTHQVNALYMGPGEYRTVDYVKIGGGLSLIYIVVLVAVTWLLYL